jgi:bacterioferritin
MPVTTSITGKANGRIAKRDKSPPSALGWQVPTAGLDDDFVREYQAILMYMYYLTELSEPARRELRALFQAELADAEQGYAQPAVDE